ncbi:MAG TPA: bifunctional phosphopantothenoylcysteine decarboxylase/phosphopantothenate--cysteine ligase CoaBC [Anaerolineales bacterium]|nr:bifunctional phosphopantothenoylcysteine decarboxylase/phosphopantothenate--cysteine ligase CoaBC [Anaerolineales bacterium]
MDNPSLPSIIPALAGRRILLGVSGSIAGYKAVDLASRLTQAGALVDVVLTESARRFVSALTFSSVTGRRTFTDDDLWGPDSHILHVGLGREAELLVVAPATAHTMAKLAAGQGDGLLCLAALSSHAPLVLAPAMDAGMFEHPATQANLTTLRQRGAVIVGPVEGRMASGLVGLGRMVEPVDLVGHIRRALGQGRSLAGRRVVVTAGGTFEPIDPVRIIANRSSGKQGFALAQAALDRGAEVTLITGPTTLPTPVGAERFDVETADEMRREVEERLDRTDVLLMAAAVADFRAQASSQDKIKRSAGAIDLHLEPTADILGMVAERRRRSGGPKVVVGFAAESSDLILRARQKVKAKGLDLIVANDITAPDAGFAVDTNRVTFVDSSEGVQALPLMSKADVAEAVLDRVEAILRQ